MERSGTTLNLTSDELALLIDTLDSHEYWQAGECLPRHDGMVFLPGDDLAEEDRFWPEGREPSAEQALAIEQVERCRSLLARLEAVRASERDGPWRLP